MSHYRIAVKIMEQTDVFDEGFMEEKWLTECAMNSIFI